MKKLTFLLGAALFCVVATVSEVSASGISSINQDRSISLNILNEKEFPEAFLISPASTVVASAAKDMAPCTITVVVSCEGSSASVEVEATGDSCAEAGAAVDEVVDKINCG